MLWFRINEYKESRHKIDRHRFISAGTLHGEGSAGRLPEPKIRPYAARGELPEFQLQCILPEYAKKVLQPRLMLHIFNSNRYV